MSKLKKLVREDFKHRDPNRSLVDVADTLSVLNEAFEGCSRKIPQGGQDRGEILDGGPWQNDRKEIWEFSNGARVEYHARSRVAGSYDSEGELSFEELNITYWESSDPEEICYIYDQILDQGFEHPKNKNNSS